MFRIPKRHIEPLRKLARLSDSSVDKLAKALGTLTLRADYGAVVETVIKATDEQFDEMEQVVNLLVSLHSVREHSGETVDEFSQTFNAALRGRGEFEPPITEKIAARLSDLLRSPSFANTAKAIDLRSEHEHTFCTARILTDLRPIYGSSPKEPPIGGLIMHNLKLTYHEGNDTKHFYVSLTEGDIETFRALLLRADAKAKSLRSFLNDANLPVVAVPKGE